MRIDDILRLLQQEYGPCQWQPGEDALSVLIRTILSQNTSDANSHRAFASLRATFPNWEVLAAASTDDIAQSIRSGGLAEIKAKRIQATLKHLKGDFDLDFLGQLPLSEAKTWLRQLPGVGPKTAACVLLFGLGRPALPVDTHVFRVSRRLGLLDANTSPNAAHDILESMIPPQQVYQSHLHLIQHGRHVCHARQPRCEGCCLADLCPSAPSCR